MKINTRTSLEGLVAAIVAFAAADAYATTRTVTSTADGGAGTLRDTIAASAANDTINFANALAFADNLSVNGGTGNDRLSGKAAIMAAGNAVTQLLGLESMV